MSDCSIKGEPGEGRNMRTLCASLFWIWGIMGLLINGFSFLALPSNVGVGTSAYLSASGLLWIGGMVLFGIGTLIIRPSTEALDPIAIETPPR
jgi:hypothetical protein